MNYKFKDNRYEISALQYIIIFTLYTYILPNIIIINKPIYWFTTKGIFDTSGFIAYAILGLFFYMALFTALASYKYIIKSFSIFILITSAASTYFIAKYNVAIDKTMIQNILYTNTTESLSLLSTQMIPYIVFLILLPLYFVYKIKIKFDKPLKHIIKSIIFFALTLAIAVGLVYIKFNSIHVAGNKSNKYLMYQLVPVNIIISGGSVIKHYILDHYDFSKAPVKIEGKITSKDDLVIVLAVGEASRELNFSLYGYKGNNTNPLLSKIKDLYPLHGKAKYGSTIWALPNILDKDGIKLPTVTQTLGIPTSCYSNFDIYDNCGIVPQVMVSNCGHGGNCFDEDVIPLLKKELQTYKNGKKMVVFHIGAGSHGPIYQNDIPKEFIKFKPLCEDPDILNNCTKEELFNSYDNTILYVDYVVSNLIKTLDNSKVPYIFMYLPDHGESLMEEGRIFHGMPPGVDLPYEQAHIPLIVKSSVPIKIREQKEYKQEDIYDTILDLFSIDMEMLNKEKVFIEKGI